MIRVLVADDSAVIREYLAYLLGEDSALEVVGTAQDGLEAVEMAERLKPDVILMDVHMPRMNGIEATCRIMERTPIPIVMASASTTGDEAAKTFDALKAGALTLVANPSGPDHPGQAENVRKLIQTVKLMAEVKVVRRWPKRPHQAPPSPPPARPDQKVRLIAIGASTGGPQVLAEILAGLPDDLAAPVLIVQHISKGFIAGLVEWLGSSTPLAVKLAEPGEAVRPGTVYLAPDGAQMGIVKDGRLHLTSELSENGFSPSVSYLFRSVAEAYGRSAVGILLTGMGRDGADGLRELRKAGGVTIAQDEESSVIFGMPREAICLGAAQHVLAPEQIVRVIRSLSMKNGWGGDHR